MSQHSHFAKCPRNAATLPCNAAMLTTPRPFNRHARLAETSVVPIRRREASRILEMRAAQIGTPPHFITVYGQSDG